jgi:CDP-glucose 4,6-dehydratase
MLKLAIASWGKGEYKVENIEGQPHEAGLLKLDISKAITELKWQPKMNAQKAVSMTMDWYSEFTLNKNMILNFTTKQIKEFLNE